MEVSRVWEYPGFGSGKGRDEEGRDGGSEDGEGRDGVGEDRERRNGNEVRVGREDEGRR